jgi:hypothetical protein
MATVVGVLPEAERRGNSLELTETLKNRKGLGHIMDFAEDMKRLLQRNALT